ncbi:hypothetical protein KUCAC02_013251 [Chaenocephalus aceratus]|nr:hypothetical protein KUCAC02_013251 [Chaenocephalus aceratus]
MLPSICSLSASRCGLWVSFSRPPGTARGVGCPYGDFLMTHFLPPCCPTDSISLPPRSAASVRQKELCSHWFPHTPCCQDTERSRRADSYTGTLQDDCLATDPRTNAMLQIIECTVQRANAFTRQAAQKDAGCKHP